MSAWPGVALWHGCFIAHGPWQHVRLPRRAHRSAQVQSARALVRRRVRALGKRTALAQSQLCVAHMRPRVQRIVPSSRGGNVCVPPPCDVCVLADSRSTGVALCRPAHLRHRDGLSQRALLLAFTDDAYEIEYDGGAATMVPTKACFALLRFGEASGASWFVQCSVMPYELVMRAFR